MIISNAVDDIPFNRCKCSLINDDSVSSNNVHSS